MIITSIEELADECEEIQEILQMPFDDNPVIAQQRGDALFAYLARTGKMYSDAKYHLACKGRTEDRKVEQLLVDWTDRLNNICGRQLEWCRTVVSKSKVELQLNARPGKEFR